MPTWPLQRWGVDIMGPLPAAPKNASLARAHFCFTASSSVVLRLRPRPCPRPCIAWPATSQALPDVVSVRSAYISRMASKTLFKRRTPERPRTFAFALSSCMGPKSSWHPLRHSKHNRSCSHTQPVAPHGVSAHDTHCYPRTQLVQSPAAAATCQGRSTFQPSHG